jgi:hypothetical protein
MDSGDTVQPLDWCEGANHALLLARARLATPFLYDYHFYHHISYSYIQTLRERFLTSLKRTQPRFIVDMMKKHRVKGWDTTDKFDELMEYLANAYTPVFVTSDFIIYEKHCHGKP